jgi:transglutaminase-like putative cysteine protease
MTGPLRWLSICHDTHYDYELPVELAHHVACLVPRSSETQLVRAWDLSIDPTPDEWLALAGTTVHSLPACQISEDPWGNGRITFSHSRVHERLRVRSRFEAGLSLPAPIDPLASPAWEAVAASLRYHAGITHREAVEFTLGTELAPRDSRLASYARSSFTPGRALAEAALDLMARVHDDFRYEHDATHAGTTAVEALALRQGVCQDFAHVMIGACRSLGLAARYVSGYLLTQPPPGQPRLVGADASHAWAALWCPDQGWLALDPTNRVPAGLDHVTLAWGRDYADVAPLRGVIRGGGRVKPQVAVTVQPLDEPTALSLAAAP